MRCFLLALCATALFGQEAPRPRPIEWKHPVEEKNFPILSALRSDPAAREAMAKDAVLAQFTEVRIAALDNAAAKCKTDLHCYADAIEWNKDDLATVSAELAQLGTAMHAAADQLRVGGLYVRYNALSDGELLARAWDDAAAGINRAIRVYGLGVAPQYPAIDSAAYDVKTESGARLVATLAQVIDQDPSRKELFFDPALQFALGLMDLNGRDEAGRFEPMEKGENAAAYRKIQSTDWSRYPYTVIVVPGSGNDRPDVRLSPFGKLRVQIAAQRYREKKAPFLLLSGGFVHPSQTPYAEAIEMKRELMEHYGIPEEAILVDPHARHTTTNMRNAARLIYRYGMPFTATALVTTDPNQSEYIENPNFADRCTKELGYVPYKLLRRTSPFDLEFVPLMDSLQADPHDPLDP